MVPEDAECLRLDEVIEFLQKVRQSKGNLEVWISREPFPVNRIEVIESDPDDLGLEFYIQMDSKYDR